jgi:hypothetical protein
MARGLNRLPSRNQQSEPTPVPAMMLASAALLRGPLLFAAALQLRLFLLERFSRNAQEFSYGIIEALPFGIAGNGWCR